MAASTSRSSREVRYTIDQVLRGIQTFVTENCGADVVINPEASVYEYYDAAVKCHECPLLFLQDLAEYFELRQRESRWVVWLKVRGDSSWTKRQREEAWEEWKRGVAPLLTVRKLAEYIARRVPAPSFGPVVVLGRQCATAGIFTGLAELPEVRGMRVGPSTPLRELRSTSRIGRVWQRAQWLTGASLPRLKMASPHRWPTIIGWTLIATWIVVAGGLVSMISDANLHPELWFVWVMLFTCASPVIAILGSWIDDLRNPLPAEVQTFADLARLIAAQQASRSEADFHSAPHNA